MKLRPNVFVVAFILGAAVLTVLPLLQRRFLRAPAPIRPLAPWALSTADGTAVGTRELAGRVWLASFVTEPCDEACGARQAAFGRGLDHLQDLDGGVVLVSLGGTAASQRNWYVVNGPSAQAVIDDFRGGWAEWAKTDAGSTPREFARLPGFAVVDQNGALRGFWKDDAEGRGNAINAARLLFRHGPTP